MNRLLRFVYCLISLSLTVLMVASARTSWTIHRANAAARLARIPAAARPHAGQRILILSPHPDDETLGCAGLIQQATAAHVPLTIAIVTNGDAYAFAIRRTMRVIRLTPEMCTRFGKLRQEETLAAMRALGVAPGQVSFLGFPDRGLMPLWMSYWSGSSLYTARLTHANRVPYSNTVEPGAPYLGSRLKSEIAQLILKNRPTDLYFTHPNDDHPDHAVLDCYVAAALHDLEANSGTAELARGIRLHTFIVHHGDWPVPKGYAPARPLSPPAALADLDTVWKSLPLTAVETARKRDALNRYSTQLHTPPGGRFLYSFVRANELFGDYRLVVSTPRPADGHRFGWVTTPDPIDDRLSRGVDPGADVSSVQVRRVGDHLIVRVSTRGRMEHWVRYRVNLHALDAADGRGTAISLTAGPGTALNHASVHCEWDARSVVLGMPLKDLGSPRCVMLNAQTFIGGMEVDRSAWRAYCSEAAPGR